MVIFDVGTAGEEDTKQNLKTKFLQKYGCVAAARGATSRGARTRTAGDFSRA